RRVLQNLQPRVETARRETGNFDGVELLEAVECPRLDALSHGGDGGELHELTVGPGDVNVFQLVDGEPARALDLRNDLVAATLDVESIDEVAAQHRRQIRAHLLQAETHRRDLVAVDD